MSEQEILLEKDGGITTLTLNRPHKLNAITPQMFDQDLPRIFNELRDDDATKVILITGAGEGFCAGIDVTSVGDRRKQETDMTDAKKISVRSREISNLIFSIAGIEKPIIAAINGVTVGLGFTLSAYCDIRLASEKAQFSLAFIKRGIIPDCGSTYILPRIIGNSKSLELMFTGAKISAQEAERIGFVNRVVEHDKLLSEAREMAELLASGPSVALSLIKKAVYQSSKNSLEDQIVLEVSSNVICHRTADYAEGIKAFLEKRKPVYQGK